MGWEYLWTFLRSGGGGLLGGRLGTYFASGNESKPGVIKGALDRTLVGLTGGKTDVAFLDQEYFMWNGK